MLPVGHTKQNLWIYGGWELSYSPYYAGVRLSTIPFWYLIAHDGADTPWDQPTGEESSEYARFLTGEILSESPWNRIPEEALC